MREDKARSESVTQQNIASGFGLQKLGQTCSTKRRLEKKVKDRENPALKLHN